MTDAGASELALELLRQERRALAGELHGGAAQLLTAASLRLQSALAFGELTADAVGEAVAELEQAIRAVRGLAARLSGGLPGAIVATTVAALGRANGVAVNVRAALDASVPPETALALCAAADAELARLARCGASSVEVDFRAGDGAIGATLTADSGDSAIVQTPAPA